MAGVTAFREAAFSADVASPDDFSSHTSRQTRYDMYWKAVENTHYRDMNRFAPKMKADYGLYRHIRGIYNPSFRLAEFYATHLMGGSLDPEAGDGKGEPSAIPIITDNDALRPAIAQLWRWSNWAGRKADWTRRGAIFGDIGILACDDVARQRVSFKVLHPGVIRELVMDDEGNVKGYILEEERDDPRITTQQRLATRNQDERYTRKVTYTEIAEREGESVVYTTLLDNVPYPWNGTEAEWAEPYGFIPLVMVQHVDIGLDWGQGMLHATLGKIREADDMASKLHDQVRKMVEGAFLIAGAARGASNAVNATNTAASVTNPEPGREEMKIIYSSNPDTKVHSLVSPLDIAATSAAIAEVLHELERDHPELRSDIATASGDASGRALRVARQAAEAKVLSARVNYDDGFERLMRMGLTIGGMRGYFPGIDEGSYDRGDLDFRIGKRPVFAVDPLDDLEVKEKMWIVAGLATTAGMDLALFLEDEGWAADKIARVVAAKEKRQQESLAMARTQRGRMVPGTVDAADEETQNRARALIGGGGRIREEEQ